MDQKDLLAKLREVNEQIDVQLEGKAPSKPQTPTPAAPAPDQTPAAVAPSAPAAGALTGVDPEAIGAPTEGTYEVSTQGDARFSALNATLSDGMTIEEKYNMEVKGYVSEVGELEYAKAMKMKPRARYDILVRPFKGKDPINGKAPDQVLREYDQLWEQWATENPDLIDELAKASEGKKLTDKFATKPDRPSQARSLEKILANRATSPAMDQGGAQTPPPGETPASVAPRAISGEPMMALETPEKTTTAATPVEPTSPRTWGSVAKQARGERGDIPDTTIDRKIKKAVREFQSEPHTLYDRVYDLYVRAVDRGTGRLTSEKFKAFDSVTDPQHQNRGRQAVRASLLPLMLNYVKPTEDTPDMKALRREFYSILGEAGGVDEVTLTFDKLGFSKNPIEAEGMNANEAVKRLRSSLNSVEDLYGQSRLRALLHPDHAQIVGYLAREIEATATELVDGTRAEFNPAGAETYIQSKATEKNRALLTPADLELLGITDVTAADIHEMTTVNGVELTANQIARYRSEASRGTRRYALDVAGIIDPRWQDVDERGLDLQEAFQNDKHPTADTSAGVSFHITSDATSGKNRNIINEIKATKAMRAFMVSELGEQVDIPGRIRGMAIAADPSLRIAKDATSVDNNPTIRLNRSMPYTRDSAVVYDMADKIRGELASRQLVMVRMGTADARGQGTVVTSDNKIHYLDDVFVIFDASDGAAKDLSIKTGGSVSQPFRIGEEIRYPGGVKAGDYDGIKFDVDPVVNQAVMHTIPLRKTWGAEFRLAYVPANLAEGMESKPVIDDNIRPSQFGPAKDAILTHIIADRGMYPEQGTMADGYIYGDAYGEFGPIYSEVEKNEEQVRRLTPGEEEAAYRTMRTMEDEQIAGVRASDATRPQPEEIEAMGKLRETGGQEMETVRRDLTPEVEDKSQKIFDVKVRPKARYDAGNIYAEMDNSPASRIPNVTKENPFRALRNPDTVEFDQPSPEETKQFKKIVGDMMFTLRYLSNKSNWYSPRLKSEKITSAMREANLNLDGTKEILSIIKPMVGVLDAEGLADAEVESVYRKRIIPYFAGLGLDEEFAKTRLTKLPAQAPLRSSGRDGADMFLPKLPPTGNQRVDDMDAFAYELYKEISREDALARAEVSVDEAATAEPQDAVARATLNAIKEAIERRIPAGKKRVLAQELLIHNLNIEDVKKAAKPANFSGTDGEWVKYVDKNGYEVIDIIREEGLSARGTAAKIEGVTKLSKSSGLSRKLTPQDRATGIAKAYDYYTAHVAADLDGDSVIKVMNTALFGDEMQSVIGRSFSETKSILMNDAFVNLETGEILKPNVRGDGMRVVSDIEIKNMANRADSDIYHYTQFARNNDLKFAYDAKTGDIWLVKVKSFDKTGKITDIDSEWSPRGSSEFAPTAEEASEELRRNGGSDLFEVVPVEEGRSWILKAKKDGQYGGLMSTLFPPNVESNRKMRNTNIRKALDAAIQVTFVNRALAKMDSAGVEIDLDRNTVDVREAIKGDKIGPFTYKPGIRPEYTFRIGDPNFGIRQRIAEVAETQLVAEEAQKPLVDPQLEAAREAGRITSLQGERSPETGRLEEVPFRPTGTRRLTLTPSEKALMQRIRTNGRLGGLFGLAGAIGGTGVNILSSGAKTQEEIASVAGPSAAIEAAGLISPALGAAANFGWTAANRGDMLRALVNFVGSVGGGILGGAAGTIGGPLGSFAGGFAGSTLGATVTDSIYSSIAGSDGTNPAEVSYAPVNPATSVPMGATPPTASLRKNLEEDPLKRLKEEYR
jgi:hypothetical protein